MVYISKTAYRVMDGILVVLHAGLPVEGETAELAFEEMRRNEVSRQGGPALVLLLTKWLKVQRC